MNLLNFISLFIQDTPAVPINIPDPKEELAQLKSLSLDELINRFVSGAVDFAIHLAIALVVFYIGKFIINKIHQLVTLILLRRKIDRSLTTFILSLIRILLYFILIVTVIGILGIETSSFLALFASAGVAIGMALSGTLQNFAGGVLILLLKPYKIGDYIEAQGYAGTVTEIQIFHTLINTPDNKAIIIPNGPLSTSSINNWSREDYRRVTWTVGISYGDNVERAREAILNMFALDERIVKKYVEKNQILGKSTHRLTSEYNLEAGKEALKTFKPKRVSLWKRLFVNPGAEIGASLWKHHKQNRLNNFVEKIDRSPAVYVNELADSSVNLTVRAWVETKNYWAVFYDYNEKFYTLLPETAGINFPFPQMDVHFDKE